MRAPHLHPKLAKAILLQLVIFSGTLDTYMKEPGLYMYVSPSVRRLLKPGTYRQGAIILREIRRVQNENGFEHWPVFFAGGTCFFSDIICCATAS